MEKLGAVQQKISCVFETMVVEEPSSKRSWQPYKVVACERLRAGALESSIYNAVASEKLDGTCVYIGEFEGKPWLWARHDRKPNKAADKRFKKYQAQHRAWQVAGRPDTGEPNFQWKVNSDFKDTPPFWIPATGVKIKEGVPVPDDNGHIPGWVPVDPKSRQHCWHLTSVNLEDGVALVLRPHSEDEDQLEITIVRLSELVGATMELIGTHVNGNPYNLGSKQQPLHLLVRHGAISFYAKPPVGFKELQKWFVDCHDGQVEGIVWHCANGNLFKVHRHHFGLKWPVTNLKLTSQTVHIDVDLLKYQTEDSDYSDKPEFMYLSDLKGSVFKSLAGLP